MVMVTAFHSFADHGQYVFTYRTFSNLPCWRRIDQAPKERPVFHARRYVASLALQDIPEVRSTQTVLIFEEATPAQDPRESAR